MSGDLSHVKHVLASGAAQCRSVGIEVARTNNELAQVTAQARNIHDELGTMIGRVLAAINDITEQRQLIISATAGHGVTAPAEALGLIDQGLNRLQELLSKIRIAHSQVEEVVGELTQTDSIAAEFTTLLGQAASTLDRYRVSF